jgi:hypothetical protein
MIDLLCHFDRLYQIVFLFNNDNVSLRFNKFENTLLLETNLKYLGYYIIQL